MMRGQPSRRIFQHVLALAGALSLAAAGGCEFKGGPATTRQAGLEGYWQPEAVSVRIAPATRFVWEQGDPHLHARLELRDAMHDAVKSAGVVRLDLFSSDEAGQTLGRHLYHWNVTIRTIADQRLYFDPVTRTYLFRLELDDHALIDRPTALRVNFTRASDGQRMTDQAPVGWQ